jgi:hypothetical protein
MKKTKIYSGFASLLLVASLAITTVSCNNDDDNGNNPVVAPNVNFTALNNNNSIVKYNAMNLATPISTTSITGLAVGEQIVSIDYRPATGQLYALGSSSRLYFINEETGLATAVGTAAFFPAIDGANASINFNPTVDRIRLVTETGQNLRLHPELGTVAVTDGVINGGTTPRIGAVAYTNSTSGASTTVLYDIDFDQDKLYIQNPPNAGTLEAVGDLTVDFEGVGDFDILSDNSQAFAVTYDNTESNLYTIDLSTGKAVEIGTFASPVIGIAFKTNPIAFAATATNELFRFNPTNATSSSVAFMGLNASETIVGLDFRPATATLYAVSNQSRLLTVNTASGQLTQVGSTLTPAFSGTSFGFDFNPTVDRIRVVSNTGQNLRLHPDLGTVVFTDGNLNPGTPSANAAAYTNNFAGATTTVLYVIDSETNMLYTQNPPNAGTLIPVGALGFDVDASSGFDIGGSSSAAFALLKVNNVTSVYSINLTSGAATKITDLSVQPTAMTLGLGF